MRNEVKISLGGVDRTMRATFKAIYAIEKDLGKPWSHVGQMVIEGSYGVREIATIIHHGLRGYDDNRLSFDEVGEAVMQEGINNCVAPIVEFISIAFQGVKSAGKSEAAEAPQS
jgi:hypothetical protein